ncbi:MAG: hypothetical protein AABX01_04470 [Candidatus Micrarchaeota archaeon]
MPQNSFIHISLPEGLKEKVEKKVAAAKKALGTLPPGGIPVRAIEIQLNLPKGSLSQHHIYKGTNRIRQFEGHLSGVLKDIHSAIEIKAMVDRKVKTATNGKGLGEDEHALTKAFPIKHPVLRHVDYHRGRLLIALATSSKNPMTLNQLAEAFNSMNLVKDLNWGIDAHTILIKMSGRWKGLLRIQR